MNARRLESSLIILSIFMIVVSAYQLFLHPLGESVEGSNWQAWLSALENSAKHRRSDDLVWRDLFPGDRLGVGDSVFTGSDASATLSLKEGGAITLSSNTLLRLKKQDTLSQLLVERGVVQATLGERAIELEMGGKKLQLEGEGAKVQILTDGDNATIAVVDGSAEVRKGSEKVTVAENEEVQLRDGLKKEILSYQLGSPTSGATVWLKDGQPLVLRFKNPNRDAVKIEISRDLKFQKMSFTGTSTEESVSAKLSEGSYFWRVIGDQGRSRVGTFQLRVEKKIDLIYPEANSQIVLPLADLTKEARLTLRWSDQQLSSYRVTLKGRDFEKEIVSTHSEWPVDVPVGETLAWRVEPLDLARPLAMGSDWNEFEIQGAQVPSAPQWSIEGPVEIWKSNSVTSDLSWRGEASFFEWQILQSREVITGEQTNLQTLSLPVLTEGKYSVRVRGLDQFSRPGEWSKELEVTAHAFREAAPDEGQKIVLQKPDQKITFSWDGSGEEIFELAEDETFKKVVLTKRGQGEAEVVFPKTGTYYWRAREADGSFSKPKKVLVEPSPPLETPGAPPSLKREIEIKFIEPKTSWWNWLIPSAHASDYQTSVTLELPEEDLAVGYHVEIFSDEDLTQKIFSTKTSKNEFEWIGPKPGTYWWRYALVDAWGRETPMGPAATLRLAQGDVSAPGKAKLLRPIKAVKLAEVPEVTFAWTPSERTQDYYLEVSSDDDFSDILASQVIKKQTLLMLNSDGWPRGEVLYWRVKSRHEWGETTSNTGRFVLGEKRVLTKDEKQALPHRPQTPYQSLALSIRPSKVSVELDDREYNGKIDGNVLNSVKLDGRFLLKKSWAVQLEWSRQSGEVFEGQEYQRQDINALFEWRKSWSEKSLLFLGVGYGRTTSSTYRLTTPESLSFEPVAVNVPRLNMEHEWRLSQLNSLHTDLSASFGDFTSLGAEVWLRRFYRHDFFYQIGLHFEQATLKAPRGDNTFSSMGFSIGTGLSF